MLAFSPREVQKTLLSQITLTSYTEKTITQKSEFTKELERTKNRGYAIDDEEYFEGVACVGIPCFPNKPNVPLCALSVSAPASTVDEKEIDTLVANLEKTRKRFLRKFS